jgi:hypothetical protein
VSFGQCPKLYSVGVWSPPIWYSGIYINPRVYKTAVAAAAMMWKVTPPRPKAFHLTISWTLSHRAMNIYFCQSLLPIRWNRDIGFYDKIREIKAIPHNSLAYSANETTLHKKITLNDIVAWNVILVVVWSKYLWQLLPRRICCMYIWRLFAGRRTKNILARTQERFAINIMTYKY